jgi:putative ABC transport system permease protein
VWLDEPAWDALGSQTGSVLDEVGEAFVPFRITLPERLERFRSTVMLPRADAPQDQPGWDTLVVGVVALDRVGPIDDAIQPLLRGDGGAPIAAETSLQLVDATRRLADADGRMIRLLALLCAGINAILTAIVFTTVASARRKDLGRRRALGASRHVIFRILIFGYSGLVAAAAATGVAVGLLVSWIAFDTATSTVIGVAVLAQSCGIAFLVLSPLALLAARRDPVRELRLP